MKKSIYTVLIFALFALCSCSEKKEEKSLSENLKNPKGTEVKSQVQKQKSDFDFLNLKDVEPKNKAHKKYLNDKVEFAALPETYEGKTLVVGNNLCVLYEEMPIATEKDLDNLKKITEIPKGTVLKLVGEKIQAKGKEEYYNGLFNFQGQWNWFYPIEYEGKKGLVFGTDLCGENNTSTQNAISSLLYKNTTETGLAYFDEFYPICGYTPFNSEITESLAKNRLAFQDVLRDEYSLGTQNPDDMVSLYQNHENTPYDYRMGRNLTPLFITTDFFAHSQHLLFDRVLQHLEEEVLFSRLLDLTKKLEDKISSDLEKNPSSEVVKKALMYFQVGKALLEMAPVLQEKEHAYYDDVWVSPDRDDVLSKYDGAVKKEIENIDSLVDKISSAVFTFEDGSSYIEFFSAYKPRGHYTKNDKLKAYFKAMTWFGRIEFPLIDKNRDSNDKREGLAKYMTQIALYINDIIFHDQDLYNLWNSIFEPITVLIGQSDDLGFDDVLPLWKTFEVENVLEWLDDDENLEKFSSLARKKLSAPKIADTSAFYANMSEGDLTNPESLKPAMGWRFLGQRFTYDAWIFNDVSSPRIDGRQCVSGLDIASTFGSKTSDVLLKDDFEKFSKLKPRLSKFKELFDSKTDEFWSETYYNSVLAISRTQSQFEQGAGFFFTETPLWNVKSLESSLSTWAELKHDTLLYVKQSFAEKGGDGDMEPTYRTEKLPTPVHYIEPNLDFFVSLCNSWNVLEKSLVQQNLFDDDTKTAVTSMKNASQKALEIVRLEVEDKAVEKTDIEWIATIPDIFSKTVFPYANYYSACTDNIDQFKMALVADVFTNAELGFVLEVAVGIPHRIYVALNDSQGGKRIAVGYTFNYYEFTNSASDRLTDEQWKEMVYEKPEKALERKPDWCKGVSLKATGFGEK